jgi:hypothetical protein
MSRSSQSTPDFGSPHDNMWRGPQSASRASTPSWEEMLSKHLESLSSQRTPLTSRQEGGTNSRMLAPRQPQLPVPFGLFPPEQTQPSSLSEMAPSRESAVEPPRRPTTRRSAPPERPRPRTTITRAVIRSSTNTSPLRHTTISPPADHAAVYLTVYEVRNNTDMPQHLRPDRRNCSIMLQRNARIEKFSEYCCIPTPHRVPKRHIQFFSTHGLPNPRDSAPGLLSMDFIAWIPPKHIGMLENLMKTLRLRVNATWDHSTWIRVYLEELVQQDLITQQWMTEILVIQLRSLRAPYTGPLPNARRCFPNVGWEGCSLF